MSDPTEPKIPATDPAPLAYEPPRLVRLGCLRSDVLGHRTGHVKRAGDTDGSSLNRKN